MRVLCAQEDNTKAINLAHTFLKTLEKLDLNAKVVAIKLVETAILHHHHAPPGRRRRRLRRVGRK